MSSAASAPTVKSTTGLLRTLFFIVSLGLNVLFLLGVAGGLLLAYFYNPFGGDAGSPQEVHHSGNASASDKIAIVRIEGVLMEGLTGFMQQQIAAAAADPHVKAVIVRINSPGGSITASDSLHRSLVRLRDGDPSKNLQPKKLVASMASLAASGGYYVAMPAEHVLAERTTLTGSIGVFAAIPNVAKLGKDIGFKMEVIKQGEVKDSGSPFKEMTPQERQVWQDLVDHAYVQFLEVIEQGRPKLKGKLREVVSSKPIAANENGEARTVTYERRRADGGIFTSDQALKFGLVDEIGYLEDAVTAAKQAASLSDCRVVQYERPSTWTESLLGIRSSPPVAFDPSRWSNALTPRLWYLSPGAEASGILAGANQ